MKNRKATMLLAHIFTKNHDKKRLWPFDYLARVRVSNNMWVAYKDGLHDCVSDKRKWKWEDVELDIRKA